MRLSKHRPSSAIGFNMTPMIDIVFLLIIFFMTVSQITRAADHPLPLPRVNQGNLKPVTATVTINLNKEGEIYLAGNRRTLEDTLTALRRQLNTVSNDPQRIRIQIRCDRNCDCRYVNQLLKRLADLGFKHVRAAVTDS